MCRTHGSPFQAAVWRDRHRPDRIRRRSVPFSCGGNTFDPQAAYNVLQALTKLLVGEKTKPIGYLPRAAQSPPDGRLQRFAVVRIGDLAKLSVEHRLAAAIQTAGDHRYSRRHRL